MKEIERKFKVHEESWRQTVSEADSSFIQQGYLNADPDRVVRIRIRDNRAWITIKNRPVGISRSEFEYPVPVDDAVELLGMCLGRIITKRRYELTHQGARWEIDEFFGQHEGLVMAEIELESENQEFDKPEWAGEEVTHDPQYSNMVLALG